MTTVTIRRVTNAGGFVPRPLLTLRRFGRLISQHGHAAFASSTPGGASSGARRAFRLTQFRPSATTCSATATTGAREHIAARIDQP
jgi:hypothetical protein